jgi:predicted nucleotide-binding protein
VAPGRVRPLGQHARTLAESLPEYDFATLVFTADDLVQKRDHATKAPRDNVIFELGLFMGALGRRRTFVVHSRTDSPMLPTDLAGITTATYVTDVHAFWTGRPPSN